MESPNNHEPSSLRPIVLLLGLAGSILFNGVVNAQAQTWLEQISTANEDYVQAVALDGAEGVYAVGYTAGPLGGTYFGSYDVWIARLDGSGNRLWTRQLGNLHGNTAFGVAQDGTGGAFLCGWKQGSLGGPSSTGFSDAWVARYENNGDRAWIRQLSAGSETYAYSSSPDGTGGAYVTGLTDGDLAGVSAGTHDAWLARYDHDGRLLWIRQFGTPLPDASFAVSCSASGEVYLAGRTTVLGGTSQGDAWIACFTSEGSQLWTRRVASPVNEVAFSVAGVGSLGTYACGSTNGDLDGPNKGGSDAWLALYDRSGTQLWLRQLGTIGNDSAFSVSSDAAGSVYICGSTGGSLAGQNAGQEDIWIGKFDSAGNQLWMQQLGTDTNDKAFAIVAERSEGFFVGGYTTGSLTGVSAGDEDGWLARYDF